ncbi:major facilitator transporter [Mesorhizobium sp. L103C119B0]|uniref:MFS transporter n=1 Tax=Mesorhizobium sp. L103C119B0 TaxID=1287085 RepID=UPI0003CFFD52|nr:MFS transporter [Mesorhizobium sp. L103C119B0]ESZ67712.1 major facilitator transporter [Mesorhizobium sp. L103C119B0]
MHFLLTYGRFARRNWDHLLFGAMLLALSSFGQTYFISLFGTHFRQDFHLSDGGLGTTYAIGTVLSAMTLGWVGRWIDLTTVRRYTVGVAALLGVACVLTAISPNVFVLALSFYLLRLGGQGLMVHTALTATARTFPADAGKALGVVSLGFSSAQALLPLGTVALMGLIGWRATWGVSAFIAVAGAAIALRFLPRGAESGPAKHIHDDSGPTAPSPALWRDHRLLLTLPAILASPFIGTGFVFHLVRLGEEKHWPLGLLAGSFAAFAVVQAVVQLAAGPVIDHFGARRLMSLFLIPQAAGMAVLVLTNSPYGAPAFLILSGISGAVASTLSTALWVDLYGTAQLGRVRSSVEAANVVASGAAPVVMGVLLDMGVPLSTQALGCLVYVVGASALASRLKREMPTRAV